MAYAFHMKRVSEIFSSGNTFLSYPDGDDKTKSRPAEAKQLLEILLTLYLFLC
jgi:hypothetical protein